MNIHVSFSVLMCIIKPQTSHQKWRKPGRSLRLFTIHHIYGYNYKHEQ